ASMNMGIVARALLVYRISDSGAILGLAALANAIPMIFFSLWGGAIADRLHKKSILLFSMLGSMLVALGVGISMVMGYLGVDNAGSWWILIVASVLQGSIMGIMMPARQSIIAEIVEPDQLMNAVSLNMMGMNAFRILAPAATGFLIDGFGFTSIYFITAGMYAMGAVCMVYMPKTAQKMSKGQSAIRDIIDGFRYVRQDKNILYVLLFTLFGMICGMPFMQLMPMITDDILMVGASGMGILLSVSGGGAIIGSLFLASAASRKRGLIMLVAGGIMGLALIGFAFSEKWWLSIIVVAFVGLGQTGYRTTGNVLVQIYTKPEYRGRVMSFIMMEIGFSSLGTFFAGVMAEVVGIQWSIGSLAMVFVAVTLAFIFLTSRLRKLD
ncbi:MAG: MFS transporter, partial [Dehalococcoidales bacterium]|nr:MFS transporter [Dehalococcoidales bacterium]